MQIFVVVIIFRRNFAVIVAVIYKKKHDRNLWL